MRQNKAVNENEDDLKHAFVECSANALRLFEEAKQIQQRLSSLPLTERRAAMDRVIILEREAVSEARKSIALQERWS